MQKFFKQRKTLVEHFLNSYLMERDFLNIDDNEEENGDCDLATTVKPVAPRPYNSDLKEGQIRVLPNTDRITYVLLLERWTEGSFLVMPFSHYNCPATDEEFLTAYDGGMFMRVLQAWNTRTLQDETLKSSWLADEILPEDLKDAWSMWQKTLGLEEPNDDLLQRCGLPVVNDEDPRLEYKFEELKNFARVDAEDMALAEKGIAGTSVSTRKKSKNAKVKTDESGVAAEVKSFFHKFAFAIHEKTEYSMAAAEKHEDRYFDIFIEGSEDKLSLSYSHDEGGVLRVYAYDADGNAVDRLDGCQIRDAANDAVLCTVEHGYGETVIAPGESELRVFVTSAAGEELESHIEFLD